MGKMAQRSLRKWEGRSRNAPPLRSEPSRAKLENTSLSTEVPLGFLYAAFPLPPLQIETCYISCHLYFYKYCII